MNRGLWSVLRERDFRLIWCASVFSDLGTWMQIGALAIFVTESTGQARWTGIASTGTYLTGGLFTPVGGMLADRYDRRRIVIVASILEALAGMLLVICFASGWHSPAVLISLAGLQGIFGAAVPSALSSMVPDLVSKERSAHAAFLESVSWNMGRAFGPILAVLVVQARSYTAVFVLNTISFLAVALGLYLVRARPPRHHDDGNVSERIRTGWIGLRRNRICLWGTLITTVEMCFIAPFIALIPVMSQLVLHASPRASGLLFLGQGIGSALGLVLVGSLIHRIGTGRLYIYMMLALPCLLTLYALSPSVAVALVVIVPMSGAHSVVLALAVSFMQRFAGDNVRGRVMGLHRAVTVTSYAVASSLLAVLANAIGLRATFILMAATTGVFLVWVGIARNYALQSIEAIDRKTSPSENDKTPGVVDAYSQPLTTDE